MKSSRATINILFDYFIKDIYTPVISQTVIDELSNAPSDVKNTAMLIEHEKYAITDSSNLKPRKLICW